MMALTANAQKQLISSYTVDPTTNQKRWTYKTTFENGRLVEDYDTYYNSDGTIVECKNVYYYDSQGKTQKTENYERINGEWVITGKVELVEPDAEGHDVRITWVGDDNNPGQLVPYLKHVVLAYCYDKMMDYDAYLPDGNGGWDFYATIRGEKNSQGEIAKLVSTVYYGGNTIISTMIYEYDDHNWPTRETYDTEVFAAYDATYENFYGADGSIEKRNIYYSGQWTDIQYFTWGDRTAIQSMKNPSAASAPWFDLNGHRLDGQPAKGLFIRNGQKVLINK